MNKNCLKFRKSIHIILLTFLILNISSCDVPVYNFFKEYTENAAVIKHELDGEFPTDKNGNICIPSDEDCSITFYLRNPQKYILDCSYLLSDSTVSKIAEQITPSMVLTQSADDVSIITLKMTSDFLAATDTGGNLSATIYLKEPKSGREFQAYSYDVTSNSVPPAVRNLTILQNNANFYVLAFNMPDMTSIHKDISVIKIDGVEYSVNADPNDKESIGISAAEFVNAKDNPDFYNTLLPSGAGNKFSGINSSRAVFFTSKTALNENEIPFTITLEDRAGLSAESTVSAYSEKLSPPVCSEQNLGELVTNDDGYSFISFTAPSDNPDAEIYYVISDYNGELFKQGNKTGSVSLSIPVGSWSVEAWAHKTGFVDSDSFASEVKATGAFYVNQEYTNTDRDGSKAKPYSSIYDAYDAAKAGNFETLLIIFQSDYTMDKPFTVNSDFKSVVLNGNGKFALNLDSGYVLEIKAGAVCTLKDIGFSGANVEKNSNLIISGTSFTTSTSNVYLENEAVIQVTNRTVTAESSVSVKCQTVKTGSAVILPVNGETLNDEIVETFALNNPGYYLDYDSAGGTGLIRMAGICIEIPESAGNLVLDVLGLKQIDSSNVYQMQKGGIITVQTIKKNDKKIDYTDLKVKLFADGDDVSEYVTSEAANQFKINPPYIGRYMIEIEFTADDVIYQSVIVCDLECDNE